jgi:hypothetical protein
MTQWAGNDRDRWAQRWGSGAGTVQKLEDDDEQAPSEEKRAAMRQCGPTYRQHGEGATLRERLIADGRLVPREEIERMSPLWTRLRLPLEGPILRIDAAARRAAACGHYDGAAQQVEERGTR